MQNCLRASGHMVKNHMTVICAGWGATKESKIFGLAVVPALLYYIGNRPAISYAAETQQNVW